MHHEQCASGGGHQGHVHAHVPAPLDWHLEQNLLRLRNEGSYQPFDD